MNAPRTVASAVVIVTMIAAVVTRTGIRFFIRLCGRSGPENVRALPSIVALLERRRVAVQVLYRDLVEAADDAALRSLAVPSFVPTT